MGMPFPDDVDHRSKLAVAKDCMLHISQQLTDADSAAIVVFNLSATVRFKPKRMNQTNVQSFARSVQGIASSGGTALAAGLQQVMQFYVF